MPSLKCRVVELDDATRSYLSDVRKNAGKNSPGIFIPSANYMPIFAMLLAPVVLVVGSLAAYSSNKDAWAVSLLLTATVVLGGWLLVYAWRRLSMREPKALGYFTYFDPYHVYQAQGDELTITDIQEVESLSVDHKTNDDAYVSSHLVFREGKTKHTFVVKDRNRSEQVKRFYKAFFDADTDTERFSALTVGQQALAFKSMAKGDAESVDLTLYSTQVVEVPEMPQRATPATGGLAYPMILVCGAIVFAASYFLLPVAQDSAVFNAERVEGAAGLRRYLLDPRNTRHREEAKDLLAKAYAPSILKVEQNCTDPAVQTGLIEMLQALSKSLQPTLSIRVTEESDVKDDDLGKAARESQLRTQLADTLGTFLDAKLVEFVAAPNDVPAHIELSYRLVAEEKKPANLQPDLRLQWQLKVRETIKSEPQTGKQNETKFPANQLQSLLPIVIQSVFQTTFGTAPPVIPPPPVFSGEDFE